MGDKQCFVLSCPNNSRDNPYLLFVPILERLREEWCRQMKTQYFKNYLQFCCENHINREDITNYFKCKLMNELPKMAPTAKLRHIPLVQPKKRSVLRELLQCVGMPSTNSKQQKLDQNTLPSTTESTLPSQGSRSQDSQAPGTSISALDSSECSYQLLITGGGVSSDDYSTRPQTSRVQITLQTNAAEITDTVGSEQTTSTVPCKECDKNIVGSRLVCVECHDVTLCAACEANGAHAQHYVLRVPMHKTSEESARLLKALHSALELNELVKEDTPLIKAEIKEEILDHLVEDPVSLEEPMSPHPDDVMEESFFGLDIVKHDPEDAMGKTSYIAEDCTVKVTPPAEPIETPVDTAIPAQPTITLDPSFDKRRLVFYPISVKQPQPQASKRPAPPSPPAPHPGLPPPRLPPPASGPSQPLSTAYTVTGRYEVFSHSSANTRKAAKKKR